MNHPNEQLIRNFYSAFQQKDFITMQQSYSDDAVFSDEVFTNLDAKQVRSMWEMLIKKGTDLTIAYENISADEETGCADWVATYTFSKSNRKVINIIHAEFEFENGKIIQHTDLFDFYTWSRQALGMKGLLLGWTGFLRRKVQLSAMVSLGKFMQERNKISS